MSRSFTKFFSSITVIIMELVNIQFVLEEYKLFLQFLTLKIYRMARGKYRVASSDPKQLPLLGLSIFIESVPLVINIDLSVQYFILSTGGDESRVRSFQIDTLYIL